jgi:hypothetical protein
VSEDRNHSRTSSPRDEGQSRELSVSEVSRFLKRLARFYRDPRTGNPALSKALAELASALGRRGGMKFSEAVAELSAPPKQSPSLDLSRLKGLELEEVKKILSDPDMKKSDLMELGAERFAISRSRMTRLNTEQVLDAIWSAVRHEESLSIISREAQRSGNERSS